MIGAGAFAAALLALMPDIASLEVVWHSTSEPISTAGPASVRTEEDVYLSILVRFPDGSCAVRGGAWMEGRTQRICERTLEQLAAARVRWTRVVPVSMVQRRSPRGVGGLSYEEKPFAVLRPDRTLLADVTMDDANVAATGTMRFAAALEGPDGHVLARTPGAGEARRAFFVRVRGDDGLIGFLDELRGVPFADSPRGAPPSEHETEKLLAVDGWTLPVYAARRTGLRVPYVDLDGLKAHLKPAPRPHPGDLVTAGPAVGVLVEDRGKKARLDGEDLVFAASGGPARTVKLSELGAAPYAAWRWRNADKKR